MAILRALGAGPRHLFGLLILEALLLTTLGIALGLALLYGAQLSLASWLQAQHGLLLNLGWPSSSEWRLIALTLLAGSVMGMLPALRAYFYSLHDGMSIDH